MSVLRTFVAIELDGDCRHQLGKVAGQLARVNPRLEPVNADQSHLTLCFLGDVELNDLHQVSKIVQAAFSQVGGFTLELKGLGAFPHLQDPRVLWLGVREPGVEIDHLSEAAQLRLGSAAYCPDLLVVQEDLVRRFQDQRFWPDTKPFRPHVTLGRMKGGKGQREVTIPDSVQRTCDEGLGMMAVEAIKIMSSESSHAGPVYRTMATVELA